MPSALQNGSIGELVGRASCQRGQAPEEKWQRPRRGPHSIGDANRDSDSKAGGMGGIDIMYMYVCVSKLIIHIHTHDFKETLLI